MAPAAWQAPSTPGHTNPAAFQQLVSSVNHHSLARAQKRRHEVEDDSFSSRDASMDRSPTPERPKRAAPKRARVLPQTDPSSKDTEFKENKAPSGTDDLDVDVGVLLASLPAQSLLPLLTSLLDAQPSLKATILRLIPRPTLETATQALAQSAKKLHEAYPYSSAPSFSQPSFSTSFGFGRPANTNTPTFSSHNTGGMRDSYVISRLRPCIAEFVAACFSYLPYFSSLPDASHSLSSHSTALQSLHKDRLHPSETFSFLCTVTNHIISQPALAQSELVPQLFPRLSEEWKAWVLRVDEIVNRSGGMFGSETVHQWGRALDEMADGKVMDGSDVMRRTRDLWVMKVGWLIGRTGHGAAARAWARSASSATNLPPRPVPTPLAKPSDIAVVNYLQRHQVPAVPSSQTPTRTHRRPSRPGASPHAVYFDPDTVCDSDLCPPFDAPPKLDFPESSADWDDTSIVGTPVGSYSSGVELPSHSTRFQFAKSTTSLYRNLLRLLHRDPPASLPVLLDYHDLHPDFRSTSSYNLLISLAIRTASYGIARRLLRAMRIDKVRGNLETWRLRVRWLVQSGMWNKAWNESMYMLSRTDSMTKEADDFGFKVSDALPLSIWMEFFRTLKYGTTRVRPRKRTQDSTSLVPNDESSDLYSARYHTLMNNRPTVIPRDLSKTPPKVVYNAVWTLLHVGQADKAVSFFKRYLTCLPRSLTTSWYNTCLDILHLLIAKGSSQKGLRRLYETRRMMVSLLSVYPTLRPTSTTLFLLLAPLRRAKRCGTVAANVLRAFKSDYGKRTEDRRVRRRVANLALKEGRMDIVDKMLRAELRVRGNQTTWRLMRRVTGAAKPLPRKPFRPPLRTIFRHNGREQRWWCRLINRVSHVRRYKRTIIRQS
ncbi:hypothetical protein C0992_012085 [Termitomyces sp. T32_za158]|nr:hypothetical protein C0992_012085 [Termitomyces sp. T32_za158]